MKVTNGGGNKTARGEDGEQLEERLAATPLAVGTVSSPAEHEGSNLSTWKVKTGDQRFKVSLCNKNEFRGRPCLPSQPNRSKAQVSKGGQEELDLPIGLEATQHRHGKDGC